MGEFITAICLVVNLAVQHIGSQWKLNMDTLFSQVGIRPWDFLALDGLPARNGDFFWG
jgi:hypothetical protein